MFADLVRIGLRVQLMREMTGMAQEELAKACGVSRQTISYLENGQHQTRLRTLNKVADALETTVSVLLGEDPMPGGSLTPEVRVEAKYVVVCAVCGPLATLNDPVDADRLRGVHSLPHPGGIRRRNLLP